MTPDGAALSTAVPVTPITPAIPADGVVAFDPNAFRALYAPEFDAATDAFLRGCFAFAEMLCGNTKASAVKDLKERTMLLTLLTCHIATLRQRGGGLVGIVTNAVEGKVSVSVTPLRDANWYQSTPCGALYWQMTAKYRLGMRWYPGRWG